MIPGGAESSAADDGEGAVSSALRKSSAFKAYLDAVQVASLWKSPVEVNVDGKPLVRVTRSRDQEDG